MSKSLVAELELLADGLKSEPPGTEHLSLTTLGERIAKHLHVKTDEVAILAISEKWRHLYFLVPHALRNVGHIPLSSTSALAAKTAREKKADIENNFSTVRHASVFEGVKAESLNATAIQKIISVPIISDGKVMGVIQISRKAQTPAEGGPDFTREDLNKVVAISKPLGKLIKHLVAE
jgi:transcriptional regulator with GAF, ATPase, and Fis domain